MNIGVFQSYITWKIIYFFIFHYWNFIKNLQKLFLMTFRCQFTPHSVQNKHIYIQIELPIITYYYFFMDFNMNLLISNNMQSIIYTPRRLNHNLSFHFIQYICDFSSLPSIGELMIAFLIRYLPRLNNLISIDLMIRIISSLF